MEPVANRPNVELRRGAEGEPIVVLVVPLRRRTSSPSCARIPHRRFDWDTPRVVGAGRRLGGRARRRGARALPRADDRAPRSTSGWRHRAPLGRPRAHHPPRRPRLVRARHARGHACPRRWPRAPSSATGGCWRRSREAGGRGAASSERGARLDAARRPLRAALEHGEAAAARAPGPPPRRRGRAPAPGGAVGPGSARPSSALPGVERGGRTLPLDPWVVERARRLPDPARRRRRRPTPPRPSTTCAPSTPRPPTRSAARAPTEGEPIPEVAARLGGTLQPFQWAGVRYALDARRCFLADEQGLGKTVAGARRARGRRRLPGGRRLPGVAEAQLAARGPQAGCRTAASPSSQGRPAAPPRGEITILNYEVVAAHREALGRLGAARARRRRVPLLKNPQAKRTQAVRRLAETRRAATACASRSPARRCSTTPRS